MWPSQVSTAIKASRVRRGVKRFPVAGNPFVARDVCIRATPNPILGIVACTVLNLVDVFRGSNDIVAGTGGPCVVCT